MAIPFLSNISGKSATLAGTLSVGGGDSSTAQVALKGQQSLLSFIRGTSGDAQFFMSSDSQNLYFSHTDIQSTNLILKLNHDESATFAGGVAVEGGTLELGKADTASGHINAKELMTFNIDTDNDDTNRYFAWYKDGSSGSGTELLKILESGDATFAGNIVGDGDTVISTNTSDGSDNAYLSLTGGGANSDGRGARARYYGNEHASLAGAVDISTGNISGADMLLYSKDNIQLFTDSNERMRVNASGNVGIGTSSPDNRLDVVVSDVNITPNTDSSAVFRRNGNNYLSILSNASNEGGILFGSAADANDGSVSYKHNTQSMQFATADVERMRITSGGNVGIGTNAPDVKFHVTENEDGSGLDKGTAKFINTNTGQGATTMHMVQTSSSNFANAVKFWQGSTPTAVGFIRLTTSSTLFITSASDLNLKKNITIWSDDTLGKFKALEPKKFRFKTQDVSEDKTLGFIAQNEVDNFPEAYPQFLGDDEKPYYGFNPTGIVPHLMKGMKDLIEKVEALEKQVEDLKSKI